MRTIALCTVAGYVTAYEGWSNKKSLAADDFEEKITIKITTTNKQTKRKTTSRQKRKKEETNNSNDNNETTTHPEHSAHI